MAPATVSRVNYFDGEALLRSDFDAEQAYHKGARERLSAGLFRAGVVSGMDVTWSVQTPTQVTVTAGMTLDCHGREIVLLADQPVVLDALADGKQNFLTVSYGELLAVGSESPAMEFNRIEEAPFFNCTQDYDPSGPEVLLAVIEAYGGNVQAVRYQYGNYSRRHVGAVLGEVEFALESDTASPAIVHGGNLPERMAIAAHQDDLTGVRYLDICAPEIRFDGHVQAAGDFSGQFDGTFSGTFKGDGTQLKLPPSTNFWTKDANDIYYTAGNVAIGVEDASAAHLTIRTQSSAPAMVATGLISLAEDGTSVVGYQTRFMSELKVGQVINYDFIPPQTAMIVSVVSETELVIDKRMAVDLGPAPFSTRHGTTTTPGGAARIVADGTSLMCTGGTFPAGLVAGDQIILSQSEENAAKQLRVLAITDDTHLTVLRMSRSPASAAVGGPNLSAFTASPSMLLVAGGQNPVVANLPPALSVAENGSGASMPNSVGINVESGALDGAYALDIQGACKVARWPLDPTDAVVLMTVGGTGTSPYQGLTVRDNGATASVPKTVAINVDTLDPQYALDVSGKCRVGSLEVSSSEIDVGTLKAATEIDTDKIGSFTANGPIEVTNDLIIDRTIAGKSAGNGVSPTLEIAGNVEVKRDATIDGDLHVTGAISGKLQNPLAGPLTVNGAFMVTNGSTTADGDLFVHGNLHVNGALTTDLVHINKHNAQGDVVWQAMDDGSLSMLGALSIGTTPSNTNFRVSPDGAVTVSVNGELSVGNDYEVSGDGKVAIGSNGTLLVGSGFEASGAGDVTVNSGGNFTVKGNFDIAGAESVRCFGAVVSVLDNYLVNFDGSNFYQITAETDGFILVDIGTELAFVAGSGEVVATVTGVAHAYQCRAAMNQISGSGRGGGGVTVPVPNGATCTFTANTIAGPVGLQLGVSMTWIPFGAGGLI